MSHDPKPRRFSKRQKDHTAFWVFFTLLALSALVSVFYVLSMLYTTYAAIQEIGGENRAITSWCITSYEATRELPAQCQKYVVN